LKRLNLIFYVMTKNPTVRISYCQEWFQEK